MRSSIYIDLYIWVVYDNKLYAGSTKVQDNMCTMVGGFINFVSNTLQIIPDFLVIETLFGADNGTFPKLRTLRL